MELVVDTNILVSFFRENPVRLIILNAKLFESNLFTPEFAFTELLKNKSDLIKYSGLKTDKELEFIITTLRSYLEVMPANSFKAFKSKAESVSPDLKDAPFFALALLLKAKIWSNEPRLKRQDEVKVLSTSEVMKELGL